MNDSKSRLILFLLVVCAVLGTLVVQQQVAGGNKASLNPEQLNKAIADFIVKNPQVVAAALQQGGRVDDEQREAQAKKAITQNADELRNDPKTPSLGNPKGDVVVVEFFDYNCGFCKRMLPSIQQVLNEDNNVKIVLKELPILGPGSLEASKISLAVYNLAPEKYFDFHQKALSGNVHEKEQSIAIATSLGIKKDKLLAESEGEAVKAQLEKHKQLAGKLGVRGTPNFIIGEQAFRGAIDLDEMKKAISDARGGK